MHNNNQQIGLPIAFLASGVWFGLQAGCGGSHKQSEAQGHSRNCIEWFHTNQDRLEVSVKNHDLVNL